MKIKQDIPAAVAAAATLLLLLPLFIPSLVGVVVIVVVLTLWLWLKSCSDGNRMTNSSGCKAVATARRHGGKMEGAN